MLGDDLASKPRAALRSPQAGESCLFWAINFRNFNRKYAKKVIDIHIINM
jgi:hypothetical protein